MDGGAWWAAVHGVTKSRTRLSDFRFTFHFHALEKEMATHSSVLAWRIPGMGEPGGLPSMGSHRVRHDWCDLAAAAAARMRLQCYSVVESYRELHEGEKNLTFTQHILLDWNNPNPNLIFFGWWNKLWNKLRLPMYQEIQLSFLLF